MSLVGVSVTSLKKIGEVYTTVSAKDKAFAKHVRETNLMNQLHQ